LRAELHAKASALGLDGAVHWPGLQQDVRPFLAAMDIYMMSSMFEGLPIALLEAMSMQCAVVATSVGGIPEVLEDRVNGFLVEAGHPDRLAQRVGELLAEREMADRFGNAGRRTVEDRFSIRRMTRELEATYLDVVNRYAHRD
jgi:glycosyltransferase involved in cell wall biosynthesis